MTKRMKEWDTADYWKYSEYFTCPECGSCYPLKKNGVDITPAAEKRLETKEKSWLKQKEARVCCRTHFDKWYIKKKMG